MKKFEELKFDEQKEITELFGNWLKDYSGEVVVRVMERAEEIMNNEAAMNLMKELYKREQEEQKDFNRSIETLFRYYENHKEYNPHNNPLTHANSYRDVLYDMFIRRI